MTPDPKILFIVPEPPPYAGPEVVSKALREMLQSRGVVDILPLRANIRSTNAEKGRLDVGGIRAALRVIQNAYMMARSHPDAVGYILLSSNRVGFARDSFLVLALLLGGIQRIIAHYHGGFFAEFFRRSTWIERPLIRWVLRNMSRVIVQGENLKKQFSGLVDDNTLVVLPNGLDIGVIPREENGSPRTKVRVAFLGHMQVAKGFADLLASVGSLQANGMKIELHAAGESIDYPTQLRLMRQFMPTSRWPSAEEMLRDPAGILFPEKNREWLHIAGVLNDDLKWRFLQRADLLALPSYSESCPMAIIEAMACGLPIVATNIGAIPDLVDEGKGGFLVEPGDREAIRERLQILALDGEMRRRMGEWNRRKVASELSLNQVTERLEGIFRCSEDQMP